ncbi:putative TIGR02266 family protein [Gammaproteobacteria bacterium]
MKNSESSFYEKRSHPRFKCNFPVKIMTEHGIFTGMSVDISIGGIKIASPESFAIGQVVKLNFKLPTMASAIEVGACVLWKMEPLHGLQFDKLQSEDILGLIQMFNESDYGLVFDSAGSFYGTRVY